MTDNGLQVLDRPAVAAEELAPASEPVQRVGAPAIDPGRLVQLPYQFKLGTLGDGRLRVLEPFNVSIERENKDIIANAPEISEFGIGENFSDALRDLQRTIVALYFSLEAHEPRLGPELERILATLHSKLSRVR